MSDDKQLKHAVLAELSWEPSVNAAHIGVTANAGVVALSGHVGSYVEKQAAESAARRVKGTKAIADEIEVRLPFDIRRGDEEIAAAAVDRLAWDVSLPEDGIKVNVDKGWVTLTGQVEWYYQKDAAERDVHGLYGIVGVTNEITIKPSANATNIRDDIMHALHRSWFYEPDVISVSAENGKVRLTGAVHSWHDREVAESTAYAAPGATKVENNLTVI